MAVVRVQFLTEHQLRRAADGYLAREHPVGTMPVPIEEIVELTHKMDVIPVPDLATSGHEAYTVRTRRSIYIDNHVYIRKDPNRRRFTLAHEVAHLELHGYVFEAADYSDMAGWQKFLASFSDSEVQELEKQAYAFAGLILVPASNLSAEYTATARTLKDRGMDIRTLPPNMLLQVAKHLGGKFQVSQAVIHRRAVKDGLWKWDDLPTN